MTPDPPTNGTSQRFRYALCNELFQGWDLERTCACIQPLGYTGIELSPFTLTDHVDHLSADDRRGIRDTIARYDLTCVGLHWLLAPPPKDLHGPSCVTRPTSRASNRSTATCKNREPG